MIDNTVDCNAPKPNNNQHTTRVGTGNASQVTSNHQTNQTTKTDVASTQNALMEDLALGHVSIGGTLFSKGNVGIGGTLDQTGVLCLGDIQR